jgi:putative tryptophan/tyrosine transport system substrate-binding protein
MTWRVRIALLGAIAVLPLAASAQQAGRVYHIGVLELVPAVSNAANLDSLRKGLSELGYIEGNNIAIHYRSADGHPDRFPQLARAGSPRPPTVSFAVPALSRGDFSTLALQWGLRVVAPHDRPLKTGRQREAGPLVPARRPSVPRYSWRMLGSLQREFAACRANS